MAQYGGRFLYIYYDTHPEDTTDRGGELVSFKMPVLTMTEKNCLFDGTINNYY